MAVSYEKVNEPLSSIKWEESTRCSSVSIVASYGTDNRGFVVRFRAEARDFLSLSLFSQTDRSGYGPYRASNSFGTGCSYPGRKRPRREADHSPPSSAPSSGMKGVIPPHRNLPLWCIEGWWLYVLTCDRHAEENLSHVLPGCILAACRNIRRHRCHLRAAQRTDSGIDRHYCHRGRCKQKTEMSVKLFTVRLTMTKLLGSITTTKNNNKRSEHVKMKQL